MSIYIITTSKEISDSRENRVRVSKNFFFSSKEKAEAAIRKLFREGSREGYIDGEFFLISFDKLLEAGGCRMDYTGTYITIKLESVDDKNIDFGSDEFKYENLLPISDFVREFRFFDPLNIKKCSEVCSQKKNITFESFNIIYNYTMNAYFSKGMELVALWFGEDNPDYPDMNSGDFYSTDAFKDAVYEMPENEGHYRNPWDSYDEIPFKYAIAAKFPKEPGESEYYRYVCFDDLDFLRGMQMLARMHKMQLFKWFSLFSDGKEYDIESPI